MRPWRSGAGGGTRGGLARLDLLDLRAKRLEVVGRCVATERFLDLGRACFQDLAGVFEVSVRRDGRALLDGLDRLGQRGHGRQQSREAADRIGRGAGRLLCCDQSGERRQFRPMRFG